MRTSTSRIPFGAIFALFLLFPAPSARAALEEPTLSPERKRLVLFLQSDLGPKARGRVNDLALDLVEACSASRSLAIVSFDGRFRLRQDFTDRPDALRRAVLSSEEVGEPKPSGFSLTTSLDPTQSRPTALKPSLAALARALRPAGADAPIVFIGRGIPMGSDAAFSVDSPRSSYSYDTELQTGMPLGGSEYRSFWVERMDRDFLEARSELREAGVGLFALKVGQSFDPGMNDLAGATGGRYFEVEAGQPLPLQLKKSLCEP